jgi:2-methylaconitate cis-trans-isomerase PrpF
MGSLDPNHAVARNSTPSIPFSYYRGGTSKALFFHAHHLPPSGRFRDRLLIRLMGSPDPMQIDGMGGTHIVTSKIAIISPSTRPDADIEYLFAQVGVKEAYIDYSGNCGNISSAVGVFAMREAMLDDVPWREGKTLIEKGRAREVRVWNTGTKKRFISHVPVDVKSGRILEKGAYHIDGCPGTGAPILMDYKDVSTFSALLVAGAAVGMMH